MRAPQAIRKQLAELPREPRAGLNWTVPERWIVKLRPLGHVAEHLVAPLGDTLEAALDGAPAPTCTLGPTTVRMVTLAPASHSAFGVQVRNPASTWGAFLDCDRPLR